MTENSFLLIVPNPMLCLVLLLQMVFTAGLCMFVVLDTKTATSSASEMAYGYGEFEYLPTATWILSSWNFSWLCPALFTLFAVFWVGMHVGLKMSSKKAFFNYSADTTVRCCGGSSASVIQGIIAASYVCFSVVIAMFFACASAEAVCDPLVRLVTLSSHSKHSSNNNSHKNSTYKTTAIVQMWPQSEVPFVGPDWVGETSPPPKGGTQCVAYTQYAQNGQGLVVIAVNVCIIAFIVSNTGAWLRPLSLSSAKMAVVQCVLVVSILGCSAQVVLNKDLWDWRVVNSLLAAFGASAYLAACVTTLDASNRCADNSNNSNNPSVWERAAWIYVQLLLACEEAALRLTENY